MRKLIVLFCILLMTGCVALKKDIKPMTPEDYMKLAEQTLDSKITALSEMTTPLSTDIMYIVDDPGGSPSSQKITLENLFDDMSFFADGTVTSTEFQYVGDVTSLIQNQFSSILNGTTPFTDFNGNDIIDSDNYAADSIDNEHINWADIDYLGDEGELPTLRLDTLTGAPTPVAGQWYYADNDTWDPCNVAGTDNYYCIYDGAAYKTIMDEDGEFFISSVELPSYTHFATGDAVYNDTSTPHVLTSEEVKNSIITNCDASEDRVYTCPAAEFGMNFMVMTCVTAVSRQMDLEPNGSETLWLNGTQMAAGEHIQNAADTKGDVMSCWSVESGDGTYEIFCKSDNVNWAEATP